MGQGKHAALSTHPPVHSDDQIEIWLQRLIAHGSEEPCLKAARGELGRLHHLYQNSDPTLTDVQYQRMRQVFGIIGHNRELRTIFLRMRHDGGRDETAGRLIDLSMGNPYALLPPPAGTPVDDSWINQEDRRLHWKAPTATSTKNSRTS